MNLRIGIIGCSYIAPIAVIAPSARIDGVEICGVAGRDPERTRRYAEENGGIKAFESHRDLITDEDINLVYIALPPVYQTDLVMQSLKAGKNVLVEKPMCLTSDDAEQIANTAVTSGCFVVEAVMICHHPWLGRLHNMVTQKEFGALKHLRTRICSEFGDLAPDNFRRSPKMGGGVFYDEAPYWLQIQQSLIGLKVSHIEASSDFDGPNDLDWTFNASLTYPGEVKSHTYLSYRDPREALLVLEFEKAVVEIKNFFRPVFGDYKFRMNIHQEEKPTVAEIFPEQNYYLNQLQYCLEVLQGYREQQGIEQTIERIKLTEKIFSAAIQNQLTAVE